MSPADFANCVRSKVMIDYFPDQLRSAICKASESKSGKPPVWLGGVGFVARLEDPATGHRFACKVFRKPSTEITDRYIILEEHFAGAAIASCTCVVPPKVLRNGIPFKDNANVIQYEPVVLMPWLNGVTLLDYVKKHKGDIARLAELPHLWLATVRQLARAQIAHGDLHLKNIMLLEKQGARIAQRSMVLVDYDGVYISKLESQKVQGTFYANYQHPKRTSDHYAPWIDYFPSLLIYIGLSAIAKNPDLTDKCDDTRLCFTIADFKTPRTKDSTFALLRNAFKGDNSLLYCVNELEMALVTDPDKQVSPLCIIDKSRGCSGNTNQWAWKTLIAGLGAFVASVAYLFVPFEQESENYVTVSLKCWLGVTGVTTGVLASLTSQLSKKEGGVGVRRALFGLLLFCVAVVSVFLRGQNHQGVFSDQSNVRQAIAAILSVVKPKRVDSKPEPQPEIPVRMSVTNAIEPASALLYLNGTQIDSNKLSTMSDLAPGAATFTAKTDGYGDATTNVTLVEGQNRSLKPVLPPGLKAAYRTLTEAIQKLASETDSKRDWGAVEESLLPFRVEEKEAHWKAPDENETRVTDADTLEVLRSTKNFYFNYLHARNELQTAIDSSITNRKSIRGFKPIRSNLLQVATSAVDIRSTTNALESLKRLYADERLGDSSVQKEIDLAIALSLYANNLNAGRLLPAETALRKAVESPIVAPDSTSSEWKAAVTNAKAGMAAKVLAILQISVDAGEYDEIEERRKVFKWTLYNCKMSEVALATIDKTLSRYRKATRMIAIGQGQANGGKYLDAMRTFAIAQRELIALKAFGKAKELTVLYNNAVLADARVCSNEMQQLAKEIQNRAGQYSSIEAGTLQRRIETLAQAHEGTFASQQDLTAFKKQLLGALERGQPIKVIGPALEPPTKKRTRAPQADDPKRRRP